MATGTFIFLLLILGAVMATGIFLARRGSKQISHSRRSFLKARKDDEGGHAIFFGVQIVVQVFGSDDLRAHFEKLIQAEDETDTAAEKRRFVKSVASLLTENQYAWEYGFWEFLEETESAIGSFNQWRNEIEASMATEPAELGTEVDRLNRFSDHKEFVIVTLLMLIDNRDEPVIDDVGDYDFRPTCAQLAAPFRDKVNSLQKSEYWSVATFGELLEQVRSLDPRVIERDAFYIYPGSAQDGLSSLDLLGDGGWKYLTEHSFRLQ